MVKTKSSLSVFGLCLIIIALLGGCVTLPKDYVPDDKVVFLMQDTGFEPIRYEAVPTDPYVFVAATTTVDSVNPEFLKKARFDELLKPDFQGDSRLYAEVVAHFQYILAMPLFLEMRPLIDGANPKPPVALAPNKGEKTEDYANGAEFVYPDAPDSRIAILNDGSYIITFADKSVFQYTPNGVYFWKNARGEQGETNDPVHRFFRVRVGDTVYEKSQDSLSLSTPKGSIQFTTNPSPQYTIKVAGSGASYTYFIDEGQKIESVMVENANKVRFDYLPKHKSILAQSGGQAISIDPDFEKTHMNFDERQRRTKDVLSIYFPEGLRLTNLDAQGPAYSELQPKWPEKYQMKAIGPFNVWYTAKDEALLSKIRADRLADIVAKDHSFSGLTGVARRTMVIPPDLASYRKLHSRQAGDKMQWYPSGFETLDYITMWPISVPRYNKPAGQDYFFNQEFYEILAHEYVHILIGENSGILSPVPMWLNEGLAVYVESQQFPEAKKYWETTFIASRDLNRLLPWDDVTTRETGSYPIAQARVHYAQSYGLVSRLAAKYGSNKLAEYVRSFRVPVATASTIELQKTYRENFAKVFGISLDKALELLKPTPAKSN